MMQPERKCPRSAHGEVAAIRGIAFEKCHKEGCGRGGDFKGGRKEADPSPATRVHRIGTAMSCSSSRER